MPPTDTLAIAVSPGRLLGGLLLLALVAVIALAIAWRRSHVAAANAPLQRLRGFNIFGPDDDEEPVLHIPVLSGPPVARTAAPAQVIVRHSTTQPAHRPEPQALLRRPRAAATPTAAPERLLPPGLPATEAPTAAPEPAVTVPALAPVPAARALRRPRPGPAPEIVWNAPAPEPAAPAAVIVSTPRRRPARSTVRAKVDQPAPPGEQDDVVLEGTASTPLPRLHRTIAEDALRDANPTRGSDILLVEDDDTIAEMYTMLLATKGYVTRHACDGLEGIAMVREELPKLVLLDMLMPRMDGLQFLQAVRGWPRTADLPVVILSNVSDRHLVDAAMQLGAIEYLVKAQTRPQVLLGALPHWLRGNRALTTLS